MSRETLARLYRQGVPIKEIAAIAGTTVGNVSRRLYLMRQAGWDLEPRRERMRRLREERYWLLRMDFMLSD